MDDPGVGPRGGSVRRMPGRPSVCRDLHRGDGPARIRCRAGDRRRVAVAERGTVGWRADGGGRRGGVGRAGGRDQRSFQGRRLRTHVREHVDRRLLHVRVRFVAVGPAVVPGVGDVEAPGPLNRSGTEHQGPARRPVEGEAVGRGDGIFDFGAVVGERLYPRDCRRRKRDSARRAEAVVRVDVPLVPQRPGFRGEGQRLSRVQFRDRRVPPEAEVCEGAGDLDRRGPRVDEEELAAEAVLRSPGVARRAETGVAPGRRRDGRAERVDRRRKVGVLVVDEGPVRRVRPIGAVCPARLPEDLVAAEEGQADARRARRLDTLAFARGPVLVMAARDEDPVVLQ